MKIFIDIGAYNGDTLELALMHGSYDHIILLEPVQMHYQNLIKKISRITEGPIISLYPYGLLGENCMKQIYAAGSDGASIYSQKKQFSHKDKTETALFRNAMEWFMLFSLIDYDRMDVKINAEGAEYEILNSLYEGDVLDLIDNLCIHYDVLKVPGMENLVAEMESKFYSGWNGKRLTVGRNKLIHSDYGEHDLSKEKRWVANWIKLLNAGG